MIKKVSEPFGQMDFVIASITFSMAAYAIFTAWLCLKQSMFHVICLLTDKPLYIYDRTLERRSPSILSLSFSLSTSFSVSLELEVFSLFGCRQVRPVIVGVYKITTWATGYKCNNGNNDHNLNMTDICSLTQVFPINSKLIVTYQLNVSPIT